jgi:hypothetical protein
MSKNHVLKLDQKWQRAVDLGRKNFEIRRNDRDFQVGDTIQFYRGGVDFLSYALSQKRPLAGNYSDDPDTPKADLPMYQIRYIIHGPQYGIKKGWCIFSFIELKDVVFFEEVDGEPE